MVAQSITDEFIRAVALVAPGELAPAALAIARLAYPALDSAPYLERLDALGAEAARRAGAADAHGRIATLNQLLFDDEGFAGNRERYGDPRNSFLNEVLDRRTGIPITLGTVYIEVARRADLSVHGVSFPGHFLLMVPTPSDTVILDPFDRGAVLTMSDCRRLWERHVGSEAEFEPGVLSPASKHDVIARMLHNLKRLFVELRAFPQARDVSDLLIALDPAATSELRDRGLIAYQLEDFAGALRDLETYLRIAPLGPPGAAPSPERAQLWEHVKTLRQRVASFN